MPAGRPSLLTDERLEVLLAARRRADPMRLAADEAEVSLRTAQRWMVVARERGLWQPGPRGWIGEYGRSRRLPPSSRSA